MQYRAGLQVARIGSGVVFFACLSAMWIAKAPLSWGNWAAFLLTTAACVSAIAFVYSFTPKGSQRAMLCAILTIVASLAANAGIVVVLSNYV